MLSLRHVKQEPLLIFMLIAVTLFAVDYCLNHNKKAEITITSTTRMAILSQEKELKGTALAPEEEINAINAYVDNKILLDEALRLGLDNDRTIQAALLRKCRAILTASLQEPTDAQLEVYYAEHTNEYMSPVMLDIDQIYFSGDKKVPENFEIELQRLENSDLLLKDLQLSLVKFPKISEQEIMARMGKDVSDATMKASQGKWVGPMNNVRGTFFIRVVASHKGEVRPFAEVKRYVRDAWFNANQNKIVQQQIASLKANYKINIAAEE